jgi:hypothetical protein
VSGAVAGTVAVRPSVGNASRMTDKPSYIGLLNAIANAEGDAECYLGAWAAVTPRDDVRSVISTVALREGEHSKAFAKRLCELGFEVQPRTDPKTAERMAIASSTTLSDLQKFDQLDLGRGQVQGKPDIFTGMFADTTIDIQTGGLLGRYIAEERDSGRMFEQCRCQLESELSNGASQTNGAQNGSTDRLARIESLLECLVERLDAKV